jgi:hypothetical protein
LLSCSLALSLSRSRSRFWACGYLLPEPCSLLLLIPWPRKRKPDMTPPLLVPEPEAGSVFQQLAPRDPGQLQARLPAADGPVRLGGRTRRRVAVLLGDGRRAIRRGRRIFRIRAGEIRDPLKHPREDFQMAVYALHRYICPGCQVLLGITLPKW